MEEKLIGTVKTDPREQNGGITFGLFFDERKLVFCTSEEGCESPKPEKGNTVAVFGKMVTGIVPLGYEHVFRYRQLEILT